MRILSLFLFLLLFVTAIQAQTTPEQPTKLPEGQSGKDRWEQREAKIAALKRELARKPKSAQAHYNLAKAYLNEPLSGPLEAIKHFQQAVTLKPDYAEAFIGLGDAYLEAEMYRPEGPDTIKAIEAYRKAISIRPNYAEAYEALGRGYLEEDAYKLAIDAFKEAIRIKPDYAEAYRGLGEAYQGYRLDGEAIAAYRQAIKLTPNPKDRMPDLMMLGLIYAHVTKSDERLDEYLDVVKQEVEIDPDSPFPYFTMGDIYARMGRPDDAIAAYKKGVSIKPKRPANPILPKQLAFASGQQRLGELYIRLGRFADAVEPCKQAIQEDPKNSDAYRILSDAYAKLNLNKEAVETSRQAVRVMPENAIAHFNLGMTYVAVGDKESAMGEYKQLIGMAEAVKKEPPAKSGNVELDRMDERLRESTYKMKRGEFEMYAEMLLNKLNGKN